MLLSIKKNYDHWPPFYLFGWVWEKNKKQLGKNFKFKTTSEMLHWLAMIIKFRLIELFCLQSVRCSEIFWCIIQIIIHSYSFVGLIIKIINIWCTIYTKEWSILLNRIITDFLVWLMDFLKRHSFNLKAPTIVDESSYISKTRKRKKLRRTRINY